ncbi:GNAT family N-acetyltransferase [Kitasatospora sp. NPDC059599]|uniref:GNAT family N-acetyltransferase n=1 Tax=Kitasatospora sp. NPDC059599 TaxID=3346880 RepID=UPI0036C6165F
MTTRRLSPRWPAAGDVEAVLAVHGDRAACLHTPSDALAARAEAEERRRSRGAVWRRHGYGYWTVRAHEDPAVPGFCGVNPMEPNGLPVLNLFHRFPPAAWGRGPASEVATAVVAWASTAEPGLPLIARVRPADLTSRRVALRAGLLRAEHLDGGGYDGFDRIHHRPAGR